MILIQECDVCGYEYDLVHDLDQGLDGLKVIQIRIIPLTGYPVKLCNDLDPGV